MKRSLYIILLTVLTTFQLFSQINKYGIPMISNYSSQEYDASEQNWAIVQDKRGMMYFGNNEDGILEYDGVSWNKIAIPNRSIIRSLAVDSMGRVYVGGVGDFGYLEPDETGEMRYISLSARLDSADCNFKNVWKTYAVRDKVYFTCVENIFVYSKDTLEVIKIDRPYNFLSFVIGDKIFVGNYMEGLLEYTGDSFQVVNSGEYYARKNIFSVLPSSRDKYIIGTGEYGIYKYDCESGVSYSDQISQYANDYLKEKIIYHSIPMKGKSYIYATLYGGCVVINNIGDIVGLFSKATGLRDETITYIYNNQALSSSQPLWMALNNGIAKAIIYSPIRFFSEESGLKGGVTDIIRFEGTLYVATSLGVFYLEYNEQSLPYFHQIEDISSAWSFADFNPEPDKHMLLVATDGGLLEIKGFKAYHIEDQIVNLNEPEAYRYNSLKEVALSNNDPSKLYLGMETFVILQYKNGKWYQEYKKTNMSSEIRSIVDDDRGNIWLGTTFTGIMRLTIDSGGDTSIVNFSTDDGLPSLRSNFIYNYNDDLLFITEKGFYRFNTDSSRFVPDYSFGKSYLDGTKAIYRFAEDDKGTAWLSLSLNDPDNVKEFIETVSFDENGEPHSDSISFTPLPNLTTEAIYPDRNGIVWIGNSLGIYSFNTKIKKDYRQKYYALIREVELIGLDSVLFNGTYYRKDNNGKMYASLEQPEELKYELYYEYRNMVFHFAAPFFENEEALVFSYFLDGYDDHWSAWSPESKATFTNLNEGDYVFKVKARNIYGVESEVGTYEFSINPPWYRTILAYIIYGILALLVIYIIVKIYTRRLEQEKIRLEGIVKERTAEVVKQKEDIEKKNEILEVQKEEIQTQAENLREANELIMAKNDTLKQQKEEIEHINKELTDSIYYAERIQKAILPNEEFTNTIFGEHFILFKPKDIVSGDFYWATKVKDYVLATAADCTGHGVPGAFMSMLGVAALNEIVSKEEILDSSQVINELRSYIIKQLHQKGVAGEAKDGMDLALSVINEKTNTLQFTGANNPLYFIRKKESGAKLKIKVNNEIIEVEPSLDNEEYNLYEIKGDKMPVAIYIVMDSFSVTEIELQEEDRFYMFSDGFADQFGGPKGKKFKYKPFKRLILENLHKTMNEQKQILDDAIEAWKAHTDPVTDKNFEQVDDIVVFGIKI